VSEVALDIDWRRAPVDVISIMKELLVSNWTDLTAALYPGAPDASGAYRSKFLFRGAGDASFNLRSSLGRRGDHGKLIELPMLRNFRKYAEPGELTTTSEWGVMAIAQHYGMPTRLLDWTTNPNVALHFATSELDRYQSDAVVWCIDVMAARDILPDQLRQALRASYSWVFDLATLSNVVGTVRELDALGDDFIVFFEPPPIDRRIIHQGSVFSLTPGVNVSLEDLFRRHPKLGYRVIVPRALKWEVRDKLDLANVTERLLFPGLQGLGSWLTRYYTERRASGEEALPSSHQPSPPHRRRSSPTIPPRRVRRKR
jgi:hypothetical protein